MHLLIVSCTPRAKEKSNTDDVIEFIVNNIKIAEVKK